MTATIQKSPSSGDHPVRRAWASHTPKWQRFQAVMIKPTESMKSVESKQKEVFAYQRQYSHVYHHRLTALRDRCWAAIRNAECDDSIKKKDDTNMYTDVNRILELQEDTPSRVVGTLVKECADPKETPFLDKHSCRPSDQLYLEDESGRVSLSFDKGHDGNSNAEQQPRWEIYQFCTGMVIGIQGTVDDKGILYVDRVVPPAVVPPPTLTNTSSNLAVTAASEPAGQDPHVLLVSSLECGDPQVSSLPREMLVSYLQGQFTDSAAKVARIIVAGSGPSANDTLAGLNEFDMLVGKEIAGSKSLKIPVDILPSAKDPTTANWPQRPLHSCLLPLSTKDKKMVMTTPNPFEAVHGAKVVLGTDGLNVRDLQQSILKKPKEKANDLSAEDEPPKPQFVTELEALELTLCWAHLCPTGPDRLGMVPTEDPMVIDKSPHIYFCGNCEEGFATKLVEHDGGLTRLVCIPKFCQTGEAVLVNLVTLEVEVLRFQVDEDAN